MDHAHHIIPAFGFSAFFLAGLMGSFHCVGMCGPLSALFVSPGGKSTLSYHGARMASYAAVGFGLNVMGSGFSMSPLSIWAVVIPLLLFSAGMHLKPPLFMTRFQGRILRKTSPHFRPVLLGALTPLIPCGLMYALLAASLAAPSPLLAAGWMTAFAAGTLPLLFSSQMGLGWLSRKIPGRHYNLFLRSLSLVTAGGMLWFSASHPH